MKKALNVKVKEFMEEAKNLAAKNGIVFNEKIARGEIGYSIIKLVHGKGNFDMIVPWSCRSSAKEMLFGSVSNYVIHTSKIPVVIVK